MSEQNFTELLLDKITELNHELLKEQRASNKLAKENKALARKVTKLKKEKKSARKSFYANENKKNRVQARKQLRNYELFEV